MPIIPDTKNWTWVLERPCEECGFDASTLSEHDVADLILANASRWPAVLERDDVRVRPDESTWSALEYAAHVRDVFRIFDGRLRLMLEQDDPVYPNWDQDETAVVERYGEQDPRVVGEELAAAAATLAATLDGIPDDAWGRPGRRGDGANFTIATLARYLAHDPQHHLWDVSG
ncbi:DinB family protein [Lacisediminihabitans profunda]|uniref:DinB family protein n=1 Tax=Lacisediminihabitans profunda TaxID=2594790 RepID=A0A5C8ULP1_9MICO|nr:DinB family protein [Lacisediminihabitans profunda]TXN29233.1 DinB family protein [Lacisediminihabitans profunda]